jgi:copper chaperone CopZ
MKNKIITLLVLLVLTTQVNAQIKAADILASGLTCSMCSKAIFKALEKIPFVDTVKVNIETSTYMLEFKEKEPVKIETIRDAVYDAGFAIAKMSITAIWPEKTAVKDASFEQYGYKFKWQIKSNKAVASPQKVNILNKDIQPLNGVYLLNF